MSQETDNTMSSDTLTRLTINKNNMMQTGSTKWLTRKTVIAAVIIVCIVTGLFWSRTRSISVETVTVSQIYPTQTFTLLNASGYVVAQRKAAVAAKTTGRLEWIGVQEGSYVTSGQVIARLENRDLLAIVEQSAAAVKSAQANREQALAERADAEQAFLRSKELFNQGIASRAEYDSAEARVKRARSAVAGADAGIATAKAQLQGASINAEYSLIKAPFNAVVLTKNADIGDIITPLGAAANAKAAVVTIADLSSLQVEADVSESSLGQIKQNQPCEISLDAIPGLRLRGQVQTIVPTVDRTKASVMVKIRFIDHDKRILPDMSAKVAFLERESTTGERTIRIALPPNTIVTREKQNGVYKVVAGTARFTPVKTGMKLGELVEVSGVSSGDTVISRPLGKLADGMKVSLQEKK